MLRVCTELCMGTFFSNNISKETLYMNYLCSGLVFSLLLCGLTGCSNNGEMISPNGKISLVQVPQSDGTNSLELSYVDGAQRTTIMNIPVLGIKTQHGRGQCVNLVGIDKPNRITEQYTMITGKSSDCANEANEYLFHYLDSAGTEIDMRVRLFNDGMVFRYELPNMMDDSIVDEYTTYRIAEGTKRWSQAYVAGYEDFYPMSVSGHASEKREWGYPMLIQTDEQAWALITESNIEPRQSGSYLNNQTAATDYKVHLLPNQTTISGAWHTPWRVVIAGSLADIVASTLVTDSSEPCAIEDTSWIQPGCVSWIYWAYNRGSKDYKLITEYIDMAVSLKLPYVLIDWEWDVMGNGGNIEDAVRYARERNIRPLLWYNSSTSWVDDAAGPLYRLNDPEKRNQEFAWLKKIGVEGVKIDFFSDDNQATMQYYIDLLQSAAEHQLLINFHGAAIPRGWQRTYPNMMSAEAVYGAEWYNNKPILTNKAAAHNTTLPFTRNVIGSMDYTPCTFSDSQHPHITSHGHELALTVVFESALQHLADRPSSYLSQPQQVQAFFGQLPSTWDETRLVDGYPADHVVMARRKGNVWYIGGLNGLDEARSLSLDWSFLSQGELKAQLFEDSGDKENPWHISSIDGSAESLPTQLDCQPRGGFVIVIEEKSAK